MQSVRQMFNGWGLKSLSVPVSIPDAELGVGTGQDMRPQLMKVQYQANKNFVVVTQPTKWESYQVPLNHVPIDESKLTKSFYFGAPTGEGV